MLTGRVALSVGHDSFGLSSPPRFSQSPPRHTMLTTLFARNPLRRIRGHQGSTRTARGPWQVLQLEDRTVPAIGFATGSGVGLDGSPVNVYDTSGALLITFSAFPGFGGGA